MEPLNFTTTTTGSVNGSNKPWSSSTPVSSSSNISRDSKDGSDSSAASIDSRKRPDRGHCRSVSIPAVIGSVTNTKSRHADPGTSDIHPARSSLPTNAHGLFQLKSTRALLAHSRSQSQSQSRRLSTASNISATDAHHLPSFDDDSDTHRAQHHEAAALDDATNFSAIHDGLLSSTPRSSWSESYSRRLSGNSIYSLASARGIINSPPHHTDKGAIIRSASVTLMSSSKGSGSGQPDSSISNVTVTTSSNTQATGPAGPQLTPRDSQPQPLDLMRRNQRAETMRAQPDRSRSRVKRRFSGSTSNRSHSPSSDRGHHYREEGECMDFPKI